MSVFSSRWRDYILACPQSRWHDDPSSLSTSFQESVVVKERVKFTNVLPLLKQYVQGESTQTQTTLFVEIHDGPNLNMWEIAPILSKLRAISKMNGVPFFSFTLLRNPLPYMVSYYNYEHMGPGGPRFERGNATEEDFSRISLPDPQCLFFSRGEWASGKDWAVLRRNFTLQECHALYPLLLQHLDWIGTVENMQTETLPLLTYLLNRRPNIGKRFKSQNVYKKTNASGIPKPRIELDKLSNGTIVFIQNITQGDLFLYERAKQDYPIEMWTDLKL